MGYLGNIEGSGVISKIDSQQFSGNNSDTAFTLRHFVSQPEHVEVFVGNVRQDPHSAYTVSGNTLTFTGTPPTGTNNIYVVFLGGAINTNELPPRNNLGLRDGVSGAPSLFRSSQIATGLYFPAANTVALTQNSKDMLSANATNVQLKVGGTTILDANSSGVNIVGSIFDDGSALSTNVTANTQLNAGVVTAHAIATGAVGSSEIDGNAVGALQLNANAVVGDLSSSNAAFTHNNNTYSKAQRGKVTTITNAGGDGYGTANIALNFANSNHFSVTLANNVHIDLPSNATPGQTGSIFFIQDGTGSRTVTFRYHFHFPSGTAPTLTTTANAIDRVDYVVRASNAIHAVASLNLS